MFLANKLHLNSTLFVKIKFLNSPKNVPLIMQFIIIGQTNKVLALVA